MKQTGTITAGGPLQRCRCELVKRQTSGRLLVKLLEQRLAYQVGDLVQLATGEFEADPTVEKTEH